MARFTLYNSEGGKIEDVSEAVRSVGGRVIAARPGLALVEVTDAAAEQLRETLGGWLVTKEATASIPRPRPDLPTRRTK